MLKRFATWWRELRRCWALARRIQRGELVAVPPFTVSTPTAVGDFALAAPLATEQPAEPDFAYDIEAPFQVRVRYGEQVKVVQAGDAFSMKQVWRSYQPRRLHGKVELYDVKLDLVRGTR